MEFRIDFRKIEIADNFHLKQGRIALASQKDFGSGPNTPFFMSCPASLASGISRQ
jgi:hypothetical protein